MISLTSPVETRAHGWPAGLKLGLLCVATLAIFQVPSLFWQVGWLIVAGLLYAVPGPVFLRAGIRRLWVLWPFVAMILVWHAAISDLPQGLVIVLRMITAVALANLVTMTTRLSDMMRLIEWLVTPLRRIGLPTRAIEIAMALVIRFTPVLAVKGHLLALSWRARSHRRPGWRIMIPFVVTAIDDAEHVAEALRARGGL